MVPVSDDSFWPRRILWIVAFLAAIQAISIAAWYWPGSLPDTNTSGVWVALAHDVAHGDLYRPLQSQLGTGGTRYMPLFFSLHGLAIHTGLPVVASGAGLTLLSALAFVLATGALLSQLGIARPIAWPAGILVAGTVTFGMTSLAVRGDFLAAALNLAGIAAALHAHRHNGRAVAWGLAAVLFAAAFWTKLTSVFGFAAILSWLLVQRKPRHALRLALPTIGLMVLGVALAMVLSEGRMLASFLTVADGGTDANFTFSAPWRLLQESARDPLLLFILLPGLVFLVTTPGRHHGSLPRWIAAATLAVTLVIFGSPGTSSNHLLDLGALAALGLAVALHAGGRPARAASLSIALLGFGIIATWLPGIPSIPSFFSHYTKPSAASPREFAQRAGPAAFPVLAENPLIPIEMGSRPLVADMFNLRLMADSDPALHDRMIGRIERGEFGAVVLTDSIQAQPFDVDSPDDPRAAHIELRRASRPPGFFKDLVAATLPRYRVVLVRRPYVYLLRNDLPFAPPAP